MVKKNLSGVFAARRRPILGVNIGKSAEVELDQAVEDYLKTFSELLECGDYFVVNVSSPNTPQLRELQRPEYLLDLLLALQEINTAGRPLLLKISRILTLIRLMMFLECVGRVRAWRV